MMITSIAMVIMKTGMVVMMIISDGGDGDEDRDGNGDRDDDDDDACCR